MTASRIDTLRALIETSRGTDDPTTWGLKHTARRDLAMLAPELLAVVEAARRVLDVRVTGGIGVLGDELSAALDALDARSREVLPCPECAGAGVVETAQTSGGGPIDAPCGACRPGERERWEAR